MRIALGQIQNIVGDLEANKQQILDWYERAEADQCDMIVFPELATCGYPPEDLLLKPHFREAIYAVNDEIIAASGNCVIVFGTIFNTAEAAAHSFGEARDARRVNDVSSVANATIAARNGKRQSVSQKYHLPNYSVFDELRYFQQGPERPNAFHSGHRSVVSVVCEDIWRLGGPVNHLPSYSSILVVSNASPYHADKQMERELLVSRIAKESKHWVVYVNFVGGQDELVFDGASFVTNTTGNTVARCSQFEPEYLVVDTDEPLGKKASLRTKNEEIFEALVVGTRDYIRKNGFTDVVLGVSGGIDSAVAAVIACHAIGPDAVHGIMLPTRFSSDGSIIHAEALMKNLGMDPHLLDIENVHHAIERSLKMFFDGIEPNVAEENIQARLRGLLLMALSNKFGWLLLTTGNKSETAVGYTTLYGDMAGGFNPIKDLYKTRVYELANWITERFPGSIPKDVITKPPSAELRHGQQDQDTLLPYTVLDAILSRYIEADLSFDVIAGEVCRQFDIERHQVAEVIRMVDANEYKRRQAAPGVRISPKAFGRDRRLPISNGYIDR